MNMFAWFDENPAMTLQDIKEINVTDGRTHAHTWTDNLKTVYPPQFAGGIKIKKICVPAIPNKTLIFYLALGAV